MMLQARPKDRVGADLGVDTTTPAVILKLDHNVLHHGGLGAIRSLGRLGVPVYAVQEAHWAPAAHSRYLSGRWFWRPDAEDADRLVDGLATMARRIDRPAVLIPTDDAAAIFLAEHGDSLRQWFLFPAPPRDLPRQVAGKHTLYQLCQEFGVSTPLSVLPDSLAQAQDFATVVGFPLIAKLAVPWRNGGGRTRPRSTSIIRDREDLLRTYQITGAVAGNGLMLQEYIPPAPLQDVFFHGYCDRGSTCHPAFTGLKERSYPAHAGLTSLGLSEDNTRLRQRARDLLTRLGFQGIVDLDFRFDPRNGRYRLLDFNPRLGAQFRLFRDTGGLDVVVAQHLDLTGRQIPHHPPVIGRRFLVENYDPIAATGYHRAGELDFRTWANSLRHVDELAWFARDDLAPFGLMCVYAAWRAATRWRGRPPVSHVPRSPRYRHGRARNPATDRISATQRPMPPTAPVLPAPAEPGA